jgi:iron complex outermembrane recepter protein
MRIRDYSVRKLAVCASAIALLVALPAVAQEAVHRYAIPSQPLSSALPALGERAGISIIAPSSLVAGKRAPSVQGDLTTRAALAQLLTGSGLRYEFVGPDAVRIVGERAPVPAAGDVSPSAANIEEVIVTGTRIRGAAPVGSELVTLGRTEIETIGRPTVKELLQTVPQIQTLGTSEALEGARGQNAANQTAGSGVNLRGLGTDATLVLVNGRRVAPSGSGVFVDVSQIPLTAIERVEILPDGASALYGSDAIGGVVNFVLRKDREGAETTLHYGVGDGFHEDSVGQYLGARWNTGSATLAAEYYRRTNLPSSKRDYYRSDLTAFGGSNFNFGQDAFSNPGTLLIGGTTYAIPAGQNGRNLTPSSFGPPGSSNVQDRQLDVDILPSQRRTSFVGSINQDVTENIHLFGDAFYSRREFEKHGRPVKADLEVPATNPFFVSPVPGVPGGDVLYSFRNELDAVSSGTTKNYSITGGVRFDLPHDWTLETYAMTGRDFARLATVGVLNQDHLDERLADPDPTRAFNPFGSGNDNLKSVLDYIAGSTSSQAGFYIDSYNVNASGGLFDLPGGTVRMALGGEHRREKYTLSTLDLTHAVPTGGNDDGSQSRTVNAGYAELLVPIVGKGNALQFVQRLDLSAAVRTESYSDFGKSTNPKIGVQWQPIEDLSLRGSWGTSFKAPRLVQLNEGANVYRPATLPNPNAVAGDPTTARPGQTSYVLALLGFGNKALKPETAETWSAGGDFHPSAVPGLKIGATYYSIDYKDRILVPNTDEVSRAFQSAAPSDIVLQRHPSQATLDAIYNSPQFAVDYAKLPAQRIAAIVAFMPSNYGGVKLRGLDLNASYEFGTGIGQFTLAGNITFITKYEVTRLPGSAPVDLLSTSSNPNDLRARASIGWSRGAFAASVAENIVGSYTNTTVTPSEKVGSWATTDLHLAWTSEATSGWASGLSLALDVQNLFDRAPPFVNNGDSMIGYDPEMANPLGRVVGITLRKTW